MIVLGLTGSIGTGKTTTATMFRDFGIPVYDADQTVHALYRDKAVERIEQAFPQSTKDGQVDRQKLSALLARNPNGFKILEAIIHPLVRRCETEFLERERSAGSPLVVLDIPLLLETGAQNRVDRVLVVTCDRQTQKQRVFQRPGMSEEKFNLLMARQIPDDEKIKHADFIIDTGKGLESARQSVEKIIHQLVGKTSNDA